ncbi:MAG: ATP-dependent helicase HrpB [Limimaricola sp.]|uniref:ATP-dependent helicase HrpB n=1 Tax=Limimaricola sp. TaxID=2211665 RepID=UPI001D7AC5A1|nr:ATP-dependent helicase HrpB [Limimaricola sp.]MBI1415871.1 ATP-dependent helicase HrpB [Limimaricola sp.]
MTARAPLPIDAALPDLVAALRAHGRAVLQAPPGAGKTTRVPLAMLDAGLVTGRIVMLEPRRLATRAAAERMAQTLGEKVGQTVGYRMRGETQTSPATRIEVVTEGILTRMLQADPGLDGIGAVIFDEFHERSLNADLGLALTWQVRGLLRPDLQIVVMSATLDAGPVAALLDDAPLITSEGRAYPVEIRFRDTALPREARLEQAVADTVRQALAETGGGVLVFLPGEAEIRRTEAALAPHLPADVALRPLYGALPFAAQRAAVAPVSSGRKVVLATAIAETSLTIEDVRVVVDAGLARRARYDPGAGMSRLVTERVSRAEAAQRAGRAGRVAPGLALRMWTKGEDGALPAFPPAEIEAADLAPLALELALWGEDDLAFLTPPPAGALAEARALLAGLGAIGPDGRITPHGRALAALPLHPRLGHMLQVAGKQAAPLAAILAERDPLKGASVDLALRLRALAGRYAGPGTALDPVIARIKAEVPRLSRGLPQGVALSPGAMAALAYPDRIGLRRPGDAPRYLLSGGKGAVMDAADPLAGQRLIVATDLDGDPREARIRQAALLSEAELRGLFADQITRAEVCDWSRREGRVRARRQERLGALVLDDQPWPDAPPEALARAMCEGVRSLGLRLDGPAARFRARVELVRGGGASLPAMTDDALLDGLEIWLAPFLQGVRSAEDWRRFDLLPALRAMLDHGQMQMLDRAAPAHFETPLGRKVPIDYDGPAPEITLRLQEMFGVTRHPMIGPVPLRVTLLSPGGKPVQTTTDIPGFWATSYADVRKEMRGRYPRHPWPDDPTVAEPTLRAKPRGT